MSFSFLQRQRPIITGEWLADDDSTLRDDNYRVSPWLPLNFIFKAFQKNDKEVEIKFYRERTFFDDEVKNLNIVMNTDDFYSTFVPHLNTGKKPLNIRHLTADNKYENLTLYGTWSCDPGVLMRMPAIEMATPNTGTSTDTSGGKRRSGKKRSGKSHKKRKSHKRGHKKSRRH